MPIILIVLTAHLEPCENVEKGLRNGSCGNYITRTLYYAVRWCTRGGAGFSGETKTKINP